MDRLANLRRWQKRANAEEDEREARLAEAGTSQNNGHQSGAASSTTKQFHATDLGNGERFAYHYRDTVRWCEEWKSWLIYDGGYWKKDKSGKIGRYAKDTIRAMYREAAGEPDDKARKKLAQHALKTESNGAQKAMLEQAKSELLIESKAFNPDMNLLNCTNGTIDLATGTMYQHDPHDFITRCADASYDPDADCPQWRRFIDIIFNHDGEMVAFIQQALGMSLSGSTQEQKFFICHGVGSNGKTTMLEVVRRILGSYAVAANIETFMMRKNEGVRNDLAELYGARLVNASENKLGSRLNEALIKKVTGGEPERARYLFSNEFEYMPEYTLWLASNHKPTVKDMTKGIWRRVVLVPFEVVFEEEHEDPDRRLDPRLIHRLLEERDGIFTWLVKGCEQWLEAGHLTPPSSVKKATQEYRAEMDVLNAFIQERCVNVRRVQAKPLYTAYTEWCHESGETPEKLTAFGRQMKEYGYEKKLIGGKIFYIGLSLVDVTEDAEDELDVRMG